MLRKLILVYSILTCLCTLNPTFAAGSVAHFFIAKEIIPKMENAELRNVLLKYTDAYKAGAGYADSGYLISDTYGEISHTDSFIFAFVNYIRETYPDPLNSHPKIVAFLMGVATHSVSDTDWHSDFIPKLAQQDFNKNYKKAHDNADTGLDIILLVDKNLWSEHPLIWWIPVNDLIKVYNRMGFYFKKEEIIAKNAVYHLAGIGERIIGLPAAWVNKRKMPWGKNNYLTEPTSGIFALEQKCAHYNNNLWHQLNDPNFTFDSSFVSKIHSKHGDIFNKNLSIHSIAHDAIKNNVAQIKTKDQKDGVDLEMIVDTDKFASMLSQL